MIRSQDFLLRSICRNLFHMILVQASRILRFSLSEHLQVSFSITCHFYCLALSARWSQAIELAVIVWDKRVRVCFSKNISKCQRLLVGMFSKTKWNLLMLMTSFFMSTFKFISNLKANEGHQSLFSNSSSLKLIRLRDDFLTFPFFELSNAEKINFRRWKSGEQVSITIKNTKESY